MILKMNFEGTLARLLSNSRIGEKFEQVMSSGIVRFGELSRYLGLDKSLDFRYSNLRGVDFSCSDLRGYDFQGADLRSSFGVDVQFDDTTNIDEADVQGSFFAVFGRERLLFSADSDAQRLYRTLRDGDPYEVSAWIHARYGGRSEQHPLLRRVTDEVASILCQKLISDDIDLTKRADLFYNLRSISRSRSVLREVILSILAKKSDDESVITKFIRVSAGSFPNDPTIGQAVFNLCRAKSPSVREHAFIALSRSQVALANLHEVRSLFCARENTIVRKTILRAGAIRLGRSHVRSISRSGRSEELPLDDVLDLSELLDINARWPSATDRLRDVVERQEEVMMISPIVDLLFQSEQPERASQARARLLDRSDAQTLSVHAPAKLSPTFAPAIEQFTFG